jgi:hypothetical protein
MPTMTRLCDIATILSGLNPGGARGNPCKFVQMRDLVWPGRALLEGERPTAGRARPVEAADVLLAARGERSVAVRPRDDMIGAFVALDVYLIKPDLRRLDADYLAAFLARTYIGTQLRISTVIPNTGGPTWENSSCWMVTAAKDMYMHPHRANRRWRRSIIVISVNTPQSA